MAGFAWVTLATNDSYSLGALVLAHSLKRVGSKYDLAVLVTPGVTGAMREKLASVFSLVQEVNVLDSKDEANLALLARPELGITFTKLHCWRLTQYEKCVFVDADTLVIRNCDELFEREELSAAPDVGWPDCFNSGVFVFKPSQQTFASITSFAAAKGSFDGGDQGLLNQYFSDWAQKDISKHLPFIYNMCSTATYSYLPAFKEFGEDVRIVHFIGITKPWLQYFDTVSGQVQPAPGSNHLQPLLQLWWNIFCENVHPQLSPVMASSTLAPVWHEFNPFPLQSSLPRSYDVNDFSYNNIQSTEPDFSEFQDPWDNYSQESSQTNVPMPTTVESVINHHHHHSEKSNSNPLSSSQNDNYYHQPPSPSQFTIHHQSDSQDHNSNSEKHHEYRQPSVLDDSRTKMQDNNKTHYESSIEHTKFTDHPCDQNNHEAHYQITNSSQVYDNNREKDDHHEPYCHREQNDHQEQTYHHKPDYNLKQEYRNDKPKNFEYIQQEHRHDDNSFEKIHRQNNDHIHHEAKSQQQYHNRKSDDFSAKQQALNHTVPCNRDEMKISQNSFENQEDKWQSKENRLQDKNNIDYHKKQTDVCSTKSHSTPKCTTKSQFPPEPCTKSKSITTQSEPNIAGQLESNDAGIAGALAKITLGEARSLEQVAFEEHMRKQSWEQGQIDYMGRDSFDNIWKKISETLGVQAQRQPSPPKTVPKLEKSKVAVAAPVATEVEATAKKSEAAVLAESRQKEEEDLIKELVPGEGNVIPQSAEVESQQISGEEAVPAQLSSSDAAVSPVALVPIDSQFPAVKSPELNENNDNETSILATTTTTLDSSSPQECKDLSHVAKVDEATKTDLPETPVTAVLSEEVMTPESQKDIKVEDIQLPESTSSQILSDSPVPIKVAESVLEAEVKESVTEDLRPVTEEIISSIPVSAQESVPATLETVMQAVGPSVSTTNGSADLAAISEIGNGIDALNLSSPLTVTSAAISVAEEAPEVATSAQTEETHPPTFEATQKAESSDQKEETSPLQVTTVEEPKVFTETQQPAPVPAEIVKEAEITTEIEPSGLSTVELVVKTHEIKTSAETEQLSPLPVEPTAEPQESLTKPSQITTSSIQLVEKSEVPKLLSETEEPNRISAEIIKNLQEAELPIKSEDFSPPPVGESNVVMESDQPSPILTLKAAKSEKAEVPTKPEKPTPSAVLKREEVESSTKSEGPVTCPIKTEKNVKKASAKLQEKESSLPAAAPAVESKPDITSSTEASIVKKVPKGKLEEAEISEEIASQHESSEESPARPVRTKDLQIPGTPTVIEATPPTSPPIGALENFEEQPTKSTKKVVKKVVKKSTSTEAKPAEGGEAEAEVKKVTKKVVKKVVKKIKEDDTAAGTTAESLSGNEKPKKVVKIVKKVTKLGQTLETDATVPETPPPGTSDVPVPPKRKLKTTGKSTPVKSDAEP